MHLDRFKKTKKECKTLLEQFAYSFKNMKNEKARPKDFNYNEMQNLYDTAFFANLPTEQAHTIKINDNMTTENDVLVAIREAKEKASKEGMKKGMEKGMAEERAKTASKMKAMNYPVADICKITGLSEEVVQSI